MRGLLTILIGLIIFSACNADRKIPDDIIPPDKMKLVVWDMLRAEQLAYTDTAIRRKPVFKDSVTRLYQQVFALYKIDKADFYKSYAYYEAHPDYNKLLLDSISAYAGRKRNDLYQRPHDFPEPGRIADLPGRSRHRRGGWDQALRTRWFCARRCSRDESRWRLWAASQQRRRLCAVLC